MISAAQVFTDLVTIGHQTNSELLVLRVQKASHELPTERVEALHAPAHAGETVVTRGGKPWIKLVPASAPQRGKSTADFKARLDRISPKPIEAVAEVLTRLRRSDGAGSSVTASGSH